MPTPQAQRFRPMSGVAPRRPAPACWQGPNSTRPLKWNHAAQRRRVPASLGVLRLMADVYKNHPQIIEARKQL